MEWLTEQRYAAELVTEAQRLGAAAARRSPDEIVETCPEWTVRRLVSHVGTGHHYIAGIVETGELAEYALLEAPDDPARWTEWLVAGARRLTRRSPGAASPVRWRAGTRDSRPPVSGSAA